jgi:hypothetical protein
MSIFEWLSAYVGCTFETGQWRDEVLADQMTASGRLRAQRSVGFLAL